MVLDTDTYNEIDDQFALVHAMLSPEAVEVQGVYAAPYLNSRSGDPEEGMEESHEEILRLFDLLGLRPDGLVFRGSRRFMGPEPAIVDSPAVEHLLELTMAEERPLYVVAIGAPTNIASALLEAVRRGLDIAERLRVVWLGGQPFHADSAREFNLYQDPIASQVLLERSPSLVHVACNGVSSHLLTTLAELEAHLEGQSPLGDYLTALVRDYQADHFGWAKEIWDLAATAYVINPAWIPTRVVNSPRLNPETLQWEPRTSELPVREATMVYRNPIFQDLLRKVARHAAG